MTVVRLTQHGKAPSGAQALAPILDRTPQDFRMGSLHGDASTYGTGRLPREWANTFNARSHVIDFVVRSYGTPIGWYDREMGWVVPLERYSVTTSRHQSILRTALAYNNIDPVEA